MIRKVCLHYNYEKMEPSDKLGSFFRFIGMYVMEMHYDVDDISGGRIERLIEKYDIKMKTEAEFDMNIYLISSASDEEYIIQFEDYDKATSVIIALDGYEPSHLKMDSQSDDFSKIIEDILNWMYEQELIDSTEHTELTQLSIFYNTTNIYDLLSRTEYLYPFVCDGSDRLIQEYKNATDYLLNRFYNLRKKCGDRQYIVYQYATLRLKVLANMYARRARKPSVYDSDDLLDKCKKVIEDSETDSDEYTNAFIMLAGEICNYLLDEDKEAYEYYMLACDSEGDYNAYAFYLKGEYWRLYGIRDDIAVKYFLKSIVVYPRYYRAWYMLGCVLTDLGDLSGAVAAFLMVHIILKERGQRFCMNARGYYCLFNGYVRYAELQERRGKKENAIAGYTLAETTWNRVENDILLSKIDINNYNIRGIIKRKLDISKVYINIAILYNSVGDKKKMGHYISLYDAFTKNIR